MKTLIVIVMLFTSTACAETLTASWYSIESLKEEGTYEYSKGVCANGRQFSDTEFTAASWNYPLGARLKVSRVGTSRSVYVVVTDRTARRFKGKRIDLSKRAFSLLAHPDRGLAKVHVERVR